MEFDFVLIFGNSASLHSLFIVEIIQLDCAQCCSNMYRKDTFSSVDFKRHQLRDATCRTFASASAATDISGSDFVSHWIHLLYHSGCLFYIKSSYCARNIYEIWYKNRCIRKQRGRCTEKWAFGKHKPSDTFFGN